MTPTLYSFRRCPYAMRARLAIHSAGIECEMREILLRDKPDAFLAASPSATVPCMVLHTDQVIDESYDIMRWALAQNDPDGLLNPNYEDMFALISACDGEFKTRLDGYKYPNKDFSVVGEAARDDAAKFINQLDQKLIGNDYLFGDQLSLADYAILPFIRQYAHVDMDWFYAQDWQNVIAWLDAFKESSAFLTIMKKLKPWKTDDNWLSFAEAYPTVQTE